MKIQGGQLATEAERVVRIALAEVAEAVQEIRSEVADRLDEPDAVSWLQATATRLDQWMGQAETAVLAGVARRCLRAAGMWVEGGRGASLTRSVTDLVAFATLVPIYLERGHYLGNLRRAAMRVTAAMEHLAQPGQLQLPKER